MIDKNNVNIDHLVAIQYNKAPEFYDTWVSEVVTWCQARDIACTHYYTLSLGTMKYPSDEKVSIFFVPNEMERTAFIIQWGSQWNKG